MTINSYSLPHSVFPADPVQESLPRVGCVITFVIYDKWQFSWQGPLARSVPVDGVRRNYHKSLSDDSLFRTDKRFSPIWSFSTAKSSRESEVDRG